MLARKTSFYHSFFNAFIILHICRLCIFFKELSFFFYSSECTSTFSAEVELRFCFVFTYSATTVNIKQSGNRSPCVAYNMEKRRGSNLKKIRENSLFDVSPASACVFLVRLNARVTSIVCGVLHKSSCEPKKEMTESHTPHINRSSRLRDSQTHAHVGVFRQE